MRRVIFSVVALLIVTAGMLVAQGPPKPPLTQKELVELMKSKDSSKVPAVLEERGVDFEVTPEIEKQLRKARADDFLIAAIKNAGPAARAGRAPKVDGHTVTPEEMKEFEAVQNELSPDVGLQLANEFEKKYPNSPLLTYVYALAAGSHNEKQEYVEALTKCEKALKLKDDNLMALLLIAPLMPQPQLLRGSGNEEERLKQAEDYANRGLKQVEGLKPQAMESPELFESRVATYKRDLHSALGMIHMQRSLQSLGEPDPQELQLSEQEYQKAVTVSKSPTTVDYYRLGEVLERQKKVDAAIEAYARSSELGAGTVVKAYADERVTALKKVKGQAPAKP